MIDVTCAVIRNEEGLVLMVRRGPAMGNAGKWEFPGGKVLPGEGYEDCIIREINEELGINIVITGNLDHVEYDYGDRAIRLIPFVCDTLSSVPELREHDEFRWLETDSLVSMEMTDADLPVALQYASMHKSARRQEEEADSPSLTENAGEELAKMIGRVTSVEEITMIAHSAAHDPLLLSQLVSLSLNSEKRVGFMASWGLSKVVDIDTSLLVPLLPSIIEALPSVPGESVQRSFMRIITKSSINDIPVKYHSALLDYCFRVMHDAAAPVAPKAYGMDILASFSRLYPDISNEVNAAIRMIMTDASPGVKAMARKALQKVNASQSGDS